MSRYVDVFLGPGNHNGRAVTGGKFIVQLDNALSSLNGAGPKYFGVKPWRLLRPIPFGNSALLEEGGSGYYKEGIAGTFELYFNSGKMFMELRGVEQAKGPAFSGLTGNQYDICGNWAASSRDIPGLWYGVMLKGGGGVVAGAEGSLAVVSPCDHFFVRGAEIGSMSGRVGVVAGASAGFAFVIATGFKTARDFEGYSSDGLDWALSFGPKISAIVTSSGKLAGILRTFYQMLDRLEDAKKLEALRKLIRSEENGKEIYSVGKSIQAKYLIDDEYQGIVACDIPLGGAGAEIGIYYAFSKFRLWFEW